MNKMYIQKLGKIGVAEESKEFTENLESALGNCKDKKFGASVHIIQYESPYMDSPFRIFYSAKITKYQRPFIWLIFKIFEFSLLVDRIIKIIKIILK